MNFANSFEINSSEASEKNYFSSILIPFKFYLALHGFFSFKNSKKILKIFFWFYRAIFFICPLCILIRSSFYLNSVHFGLNINFILLLTFVVWSFLSTCGTIFMMNFISKNKLEELENLWKKYKLDSFIQVEFNSVVVYIPALYPVFHMVMNVSVLILQAAEIIPSQNLDFSFNNKAPYLLPILASFSMFGWSSCQGLYIANVNHSILQA